MLSATPGTGRLSVSETIPFNVPVVRAHAGADGSSARSSAKASRINRCFMLVARVGSTVQENKIAKIAQNTTSSSITMKTVSTKKAKFEFLCLANGRTNKLQFVSILVFKVGLVGDEHDITLCVGVFFLVASQQCRFS